jgi:pimeloyl-ACP methyl ester carboxylesterase
VSQHLVRRSRRVQIAYEQTGTGPTVALVQGLGLPGRMWLGLPGGLARSGFRVLVPDNRGTGRSSVPFPPYRMSQLADDLEAVLSDACAPGERALVVGISLGGMIAQHLALRHPGRVAGLVLAATSPGPPHGRPPPVGFLEELGRSLQGDREAQGGIRRRLFHARTIARVPDLFERWDREVLTQPCTLRGFLGQLAAASLHSTGHRLHRVLCPVEVVTGDSDGIIPPENSEVLARLLPDARLTVLAEAGHAFPFDAPAALPRLVRRLHERARAQGLMT